MARMKFPDPDVIDEAVINGVAYKFVGGAWRINQYPAAQGNTIVQGASKPYVGETPPENPDEWFWQDPSGTLRYKRFDNEQNAFWLPLLQNEKIVSASNGSLDFSKGRSFSVDLREAVGTTNVSFNNYFDSQMASLVTVFVIGTGTIVFPSEVEWETTQPALSTGTTSFVFLRVPGTNKWLGRQGPSTNTNLFQ